MDGSGASVDSCDVDLPTPPETATRPNPFENDDASSSRKRRRTSTSASMSPIPQERPSGDTDTNNPNHIIRQHDQGSALRETIPIPDSQTDKTQTALLPDSTTSLDPSSQLTLSLRRIVNDNRSDLSQKGKPFLASTVNSPVLEQRGTSDEDHGTTTRSYGSTSSSDLEEIVTPPEAFPFRQPKDDVHDPVTRLVRYLSHERNIDLVNLLQRLSNWMQHSAIKFIKTSDWSTVQVALRSQNTFWASFPAIMNAIMARICDDSPDPINCAAEDILSLYSLLTAALVKFDHGTLQRAVLRVNQDDEFIFYSTGFLRVWYDLMHIEEQETPNAAQNTAWTRCAMSRILVSPLITTQDEGTQWISSFAYSLATFATTPKFQLRDFALVTCVINDCVTAYHHHNCRRSDIALAEAAPIDSVDSSPQTRKLWLTLSDTFTAIIEKNISILSVETTYSLFRALSNVLSIICQSDNLIEKYPRDGIDDLVEKFRSKHPEAIPKVVQRAAPWEWRLGVLAKLIQSGLMQLRVMAVKTLCGYLSDIWAHQEATVEGRDLLRYVGHIVDTELIGYIVSPSCHPEIILASTNIVLFLALSDASTDLLIDRLWRSIRASQDPRVADAITRVTNSVLTALPYGQLVHLCERFNEIGWKDFSPLLQNLWENLIREMVSKVKRTGQPLSAHPFLSILHVLREVPTCKNGDQYVNADLHLVATTQIRELLNTGLEIQVRKQLYTNCIEHLMSRSPTTLGSLWFLSICLRPAIAAELHCLTEEHDIVRVVVEELESAVSTASDTSMTVFSGQANQARRDLISQIIHFQHKSVTEDLGIRLWEALVGSTALNTADREAAWNMILIVGKDHGFGNPFLQTCFSTHLRNLPAALYCEGMLSFVQENVLRLVNDGNEFSLNHEEFVSDSGIEHVWRVILSAYDESIAMPAIVLLASRVYLQSKAIASCTENQARNFHLKLVRQCLKLMREAGHAIQAVPTDEDADDESIVVVEPEREMKQKKLEFLRALRLLHLFLEAHREHPRYAIADLRSLIPECAAEVKGELTSLCYQAFSHDSKGEVKRLKIGRGNSLGSLLAALRDETGFKSYEAYYRGRHLNSTEAQSNSSLQDLDMCYGLILVKEAIADSEMPRHVKAGSSAIEIEIISQFSQFWQYLIMEETIAVETYHFLLRLPADGQLMLSLSADDVKYEDHFVPDQPYRLLYTIFALMECVRHAQSRQTLVSACSSPTVAAETTEACAQMVNRALQLLARCLDDVMITQISGRVRVLVMSTLVEQFLCLLDVATGHAAPDQGLPMPSPSRIMSILDDAASSSQQELIPLSVKCLSLVLRLGLIDEQFWLVVSDGPLLATHLRRMCVMSSQVQVREHCISMIDEVIMKESEMAVGNGRIAKYSWNWALDALETIPDMGENCRELMILMCGLVLKMRLEYPESTDLASLVQQLTKYLVAHTCTEEISQVTPCDAVTEGLATILNRCIRFDRALAQYIPSDSIAMLLKVHLFPQEKGGTSESLPRIILNPTTRAQLYECVFFYIRANNDKLMETMQFLGSLVPFNATGEPYKYDLPFQFEHEKALRSPAGYVGLQNLSNTCYLNSLITQLYMNPGFRSYLMSFDVEEGDDSRALLRETQQLFLYLQESITRSVEPRYFVGAIKTYDQGPIDINSQMDVDEFYNLLFDRWEAQLPNATARAGFRSIYGGQLVQQIKSKECGHISERLEPFSAIQCDIKGKSTLQDSLKAYVGGEIMDGDNKYKCSSCDRHVDAVKRTCLKDTPDNVIFHLKRFDFDLHTLQRSKIDDYFAFPDVIDLQPYKVEHLSGSAPDDKQDMFELVGILVHSGTAESGHYYSYVRERSANQETTAKWIEFNDDQVGIWDHTSMKASTFGGMEHRPGYEDAMMPFKKSYSAYMLFYQRRMCAPRPAAEAEPVSEVDMCSDTMMSEALKEHIHSENILLLQRHCLFDPSHGRFVQACVSQCLQLQGFSQTALELDGQPLDEPPTPKTCQLAVRTALNYLDQIFSRSKDWGFAVAFCNMLNEAAQRQYGCARQVLAYFRRRPAVLRSLLLRNPERGVRIATGQLFVSCLRTLSMRCPQLFYSQSDAAILVSDDEDEDMDFEDAGDDIVLSRAVEPLNQLWHYFQNNIRAWDEYFHTILAVAKLGRQECGAILAAGFLEKCFRIISADRCMELEANFVRMLQNVYRRFSTQPPSYAAILELIDYLMGQLEPEISPDMIVESEDERLAYTSEYLPWTSREITLFLNHPDEECSSLFMARLLQINQAPEATRRILEKILRAGELPTEKLLYLLENTIQDSSTEPLEAYIRAAAVVVENCSRWSAVQRLIQHISNQAASFERGEGEAFLGLIQRAIDNNRANEEERSQIRFSTLLAMPRWAPALLQYPDGQVRNGAENLVDMALRLPVDSGSQGAELAEVSSGLGLAIGRKCIQYFHEAHVRRGVVIERELAAVLIRVLGNCSLVVSASETLSEDNKEVFDAQYRAILEKMTALEVDRVVEDGSDWEGSALSSEPMEDAEGEAVTTLMENGYV